MENFGKGKAPGKEEASDKDSRYSTFRERMLEHSFLAELLQEFWVRRSDVVAVSRSEVDTGYDLVLEVGGIIRHVQLKSTRRDGRAAYQTLHWSLASKPSGCAVWIEFEESPVSGRLELTYRFFGGLPGSSMPNISNYPVARHAKANMKGEKTARPELRRVPKREFKELGSIRNLCDRLFGPPKSGADDRRKQAV